MSRRAAHISADPFVRVSHHSFRSFSSRWRVKWLVKLSLRMGTWFRWLPAVGEASVLGSLERCLGSMGLRGMLGLFPATGCEAEPRGDDAAEPRDGVGLVMLRWEALRWLDGSPPASVLETQQPYADVSQRPRGLKHGEVLVGQYRRRRTPWHAGARRRLTWP